MFKEILQITPKVSPGDLNNMERSLQGRFTRIAKKFGSGLVSSLKGGGIAGAALGFIDKLLNPLKETQDAMEKMLKQSDDLVANAKQFGTTEGALARLQAIAGSTGLDSDTLNMLLIKFQTAVAEAAADPKKQTSVRNFAGEKDMAQGFFRFIQSLQKMPDPNKRSLVQQEIFGEKLIGRMADFVGSDFAEVVAKLGGPSAEQLTPSIRKLGDLNDTQDTNRARNNLTDLINKGKLINEEMIAGIDRREKFELQSQNINLKNFENLTKIANLSDQMMFMLSQIPAALVTLTQKIASIDTSIKAIQSSRPMKGIMKFLGRE